MYILRKWMLNIIIYMLPIVITKVFFLIIIEMFSMIGMKMCFFDIIER